MGFPFWKIHQQVENQWAVFGDDIIVRREAFDYVVAKLSMLNHVVNTEKSFNTGHFRESCGTDWYRGYNIRGVYVKSLTNPGEVYSAINRLVKWSAVHGINLSSALRILLRQVCFNPVPFEESDSAGIKIPLSARPPRLKTPRQVEAKSADWCGAVAYKALTTSQRRATIPVISGEITDPASSAGDARYHLPGFEAGWLVTALGGYCGTPPSVLERIHHPDVPSAGRELLRPVVIGIRDDSRTVRWKVKWRLTTSWDESPPLPAPDFGPARGDAWKNVAGNLEFLKLLPVA